MSIKLKEKNMDRNLGENIKYKRKEKNMTQQKLAKG